MGRIERALLIQGLEAALGMTWGCPEGTKCWRSLAIHSSHKEAVLNGAPKRHVSVDANAQKTNKDHLHQLLYSVMRERRLP